MKAVVTHRVCLAGALCVTLLIAACAPYPVQEVNPSLPVERARELVETPFFPQDKYQCGPASLATVLNAAGADVSPGQLKPLVYLPGNKGSLQAEMLATASRYGYLAVAVPPALDSLLLELSAGRPVLVLQNLGVAVLPVWHYAVVIGYNLEQRTFYLRSGRDKRKVYSFKRFLESWSRAGYWAMVAVVPGEVPVSANAADYLRAASALERQHKPAAAWRAYSAGTRRWPDQPLLWAAAGNAAYSLERFADAEAAYREALALQPGAAPILNNLALALAAQGCSQTALSVLDCVLKRVPTNTVLEETLQEINGLPKETGDCRRFVCDLPETGVQP
ncbi:MAG TPA: peptidase C39 family protein [Gammaproteobacteria bacterium]|nr:peptidase C39 family protein [Gammaproteobacteria bacterium]